MSIDNILAKLGLTDEEAMEFVNHYNRQYFDHCSFSVNVSADTQWEGDSNYATVRVDVSLQDAKGFPLFSGDEYCNFSLK